MSQFAGWLAQRYRNNRPLAGYENAADVRNFDSSTFAPLDKGIVYLDDDCIEYVDRHFLYRGWAAMWGFVVIGLVLLFVSAITHATVTMQAEGRAVSSEMAITVTVLGALMLGLVVFTYQMLLGRDIFRYQYYPIRFDRTTRQVHVFTGGRNKVVSAPWSDIHFIIGRDKPAGPGEGYTYDLRGLVMRGDQVVHTFAVGSDCGSNPAIVLAHWEMIRRFMEEGRSALPFPPLQLYTSVVPSFRNAFIIHVSSAGAGLMLIALPLTLPWALFRFLAMKLCRKPVWPAAATRRGRAEPSGTPPLRAPAVYGRVDHSGGRADEMERFWKDSIAAAKARNDEVRQQLKERGAGGR
ncbi:DUF6708 domain-containing protein [Stenotrophomonas indicatrix]|uniref:DUF6708 domain-containing protein n=1 Tax=Stenotrophomonas indicatrix TaxID=2045451 RepID=UPI001AA0E653|nr:DUF6708 domain-containing protein [Stenotrophomonas indicatrix]MBO1748567.1 hypothetical protein [Stenotrophomonas indicatrix]